MKGHEKRNFAKVKYVNASAGKCIAIKHIPHSSVRLCSAVGAGCQTPQKAPGDRWSHDTRNPIIVALSLLMEALKETAWKRLIGAVSCDGLLLMHERGTVRVA